MCEFSFIHPTQGMPSFSDVQILNLTSIAIIPIIAYDTFTCWLLRTSQSNKLSSTHINYYAFYSASTGFEPVLLTLAVQFLTPYKNSNSMAHLRTCRTHLICLKIFIPCDTKYHSSDTKFITFKLVLP